MRRWTGFLRGWVAHLKISLYEMFNISDIFITLLQEFFKKFARDGISKYQSENVAFLVQQIDAVVERLAELPALPRDTPLLFLTGFAKYSVTDSFVPF